MPEALSAEAVAGTSTRAQPSSCAIRPMFMPAAPPPASTRLSGGQQQRVAIARALVKAPKLVIADEPTANLDSVNGAAVLDLMRKLNEERGATFLFSTHDNLVLSRVNRIVRLRDGEIVADERVSR